MLWAGTSDATAMMAVPVSLAVLQKLGLDHVRQYNHALLLEAVALLTAAWTTSTVIGAPRLLSPLHLLPDIDGSASGFLTTGLLDCCLTTKFWYWDNALVDSRHHMILLHTLR